MKLAIALLLASVSLVAAQNKMGIWSPLYYKLNPSTDDEYANFINAVSNNKCLDSSFQGAILVGPTSQPPPLKNDPSPGQNARAVEYQRRFDYLYNAPGWQPFGYVYTNYGNRPIDAVLSDIAAWCDAVNGYRKSVRGIFVDQVAEALPVCDPADPKASKNPDCELRAYYQKVMDAIHTQCASTEFGDPMIMLNPGRAFSECKFMADNKVAFVNAWEDTYATYQKFSAAKNIDCACKDQGVRCVGSIHSVPSDITADQVTAVMQDMANNGFSALFLTENKFPHHYETVPTIWPQVAKAACSVEAYQPPSNRRLSHRRMMTV